MSTDFGRLMDPDLREHFVYRALDAEGRLLYVGCSMNVERRMAEHKAWGEWTHRVARLKLAGPYNYSTARRMEREAIQSEDPLFNAQAPRRRAARRRQHKLFDEVLASSLTQGESRDEAVRLALLAVDSEMEVLA
jgi:predicted GIY-YIG superfamily endonuclease